MNISFITNLNTNQTANFWSYGYGLPDSIKNNVSKINNETEISISSGFKVGDTISIYNWNPRNSSEDIIDIGKCEKITKFGIERANLEELDYYSFLKETDDEDLPEDSDTTILVNGYWYILYDTLGARKTKDGDKVTVTGFNK